LKVLELKKTAGIFKAENGAQVSAGGVRQNQNNCTIDDVGDHAQQPTSEVEVQYHGRLDCNVTERDLVAFSICEVPVSSSFYNDPSRPMNFYHHDAINEAMTDAHLFSDILERSRCERRGLALERNQLESSRAMGLAHGQPRQYRIRESVKYRRCRTSVFDQ
jgi:hypothetical protein